MTAAFSVFPNGGLAVRPRDLVRVVDADGSTALATTPETERVLSPAVSFQMVSMLSDVVERGTGTAARRLGVQGPVGGKTGTTDDFKDAWFVGFSSSMVVGVWVGFDQPRTIASDGYGARMALPIWADFMRAERASASSRGVRAACRSPGRDVVRRSYLKTGGRMPALHRVPQRGRPGARAVVHAASRHHPSTPRADHRGVGVRGRAPHPRRLPLKRVLALTSGTARSGRSGSQMFSLNSMISV